MASAGDSPLGAMAGRDTTETLYVTLWNSTRDTVTSNTTPASNASVDEEAAHFERVVSIVVPTLFGIVFLLGLFGNTLVILVVALDKNMRNTTNILILMLAVADLLFIVLCVPFTAASYAMPVWPFGKIWCKVVQYLNFVSAYASVYTLVLMSLDRYLAVVHAIRSMSIRNERNTWLAVCVTWAFLGACHIPLLFEYDVLEYNHGPEVRSTCINTLHLEMDVMAVVFQACFLVFGYVLPLGAVCLMYGLMLKRLHGAAPGGVSKSQESMRAKRRVTKMVVIIVAVFAVCWLPIQVILLSEKLKVLPKNIPFISLMLAANCLSYMNSCVNPFLYAFLSENFRRSFKKILCCSSPVSRRSEYELVSVKQSEAVTQATAIKGCV